MVDRYRFYCVEKISGPTLQPILNSRPLYLCSASFCHQMSHQAAWDESVQSVLSV